MFSKRIEEIESKIQNGQIIEKATVDEMLDEVSYMVVYPTYMEIYFNIANIAGLEEMGISSVLDEEKLTIEYGNLFNYRERKKEEGKL